MNYAYLSLGTNLFDRMENLRRAVRRIWDFGEIVAVSSVYETQPHGFEFQRPFLNMVILVSFSDGPFHLLDAVSRVEKVMGRKRPFPNAPRIIDIDILFFGNIAIGEPRLTIPHRGFYRRKFMYMPAVEIASLGFRPFWYDEFSPQDGWIRLYRMRPYGGSPSAFGIH